MTCYSVNVRIAVAAIGVFVGVFCVIVFPVQFQNYNAGIWALVQGIFAGITMWIHIMYKRDTLQNRGMQFLKNMMLVGCFTQLAGVCAFVAYISAAGVLGQGISGDAIYGPNYWIASVWGFMTWKWGFQLFWFSREYKREYERNAMFTTKDYQSRDVAY